MRYLLAFVVGAWISGAIVASDDAAIGIAGSLIMLVLTVICAGWLLWPGLQMLIGGL